MYFLEQTCMAE